MNTSLFIFTELKLANFNSLFEVFMPVGFGVFAVRQALEWIIDFISSYKSTIGEFRELVQKVENELEPDQSPVVIQRLSKLRMELNSKQEVMDRKEKDLVSASRVDFLQLGFFTFGMLIITGFEDFFHQINQSLNSSNLVYILCSLSIFLYVVRNWTFKIDNKNNNYKIFDDGIKHFPITATKSMIIFALFLFYCFLLSHSNLSSIPQIVLVFLSISNLILPFFLLYRRSLKFNGQVQKFQEARRFLLKSEREFVSIKQLIP